MRKRGRCEGSGGFAAGGLVGGMKDRGRRPFGDLGVVTRTRGSGGVGRKMIELSASVVRSPCLSSLSLSSTPSFLKWERDDGDAC